MNKLKDFLPNWTTVSWIVIELILATLVSFVPNFFIGFKDESATELGIAAAFMVLLVGESLRLYQARIGLRIELEKSNSTISSIQQVFAEISKEMAEAAVNPATMETLSVVPENSLSEAVAVEENVDFDLSFQLENAKCFIDFPKTTTSEQKLIGMLGMIKNITISCPNFQLSKPIEMEKDFDQKFNSSDTIFIVFDEEVPVEWLIAQLLYCSRIAHHVSIIIYTGTSELPRKIFNILLKYKFNKILSEQELRPAIERCLNH